MRQAPPLTRFIAFPITSGTALMAIAVTALAMAGREIEPLLMTVRAFEGEPWRLLTSALPHSGVVHLLFNIIWLWVFGTAIEAVWGPVRTLAIFAVLAVASTLGEYALFRGGIGLSGVGYGLFGLLLVLSRRDRRFADTIDRRTIHLFIGWFFFCIALTAAGVLAIANVAHGVGALAGALLGLVIARKSLAPAIAAAAGLAGLLAAGVAGATVLRPIVNLAESGGADSARIGAELLMANDNAEAVRHLRRAVEISPTISSAWYNLALGLERLERPDEALPGYQRAYELDGEDPQYRRAFASAINRRGNVLAEQGDDAAAVTEYKRGLAINPESKSLWFNLSLSYSNLSKLDEAADAARRAHALDPTHTDYQRRLADVLLALAEELDHNDRSLALSEEAARVYEASYVYLYLADLLERHGRDDDAAVARDKGQALLKKETQHATPR